MKQQPLKWVKKLLTGVALVGLLLVAIGLWQYELVSELIVALIDRLNPGR